MALFQRNKQHEWQKISNFMTLKRYETERKMFNTPDLKYKNYNFMKSFEKNMFYFSNRKHTGASNVTQLGTLRVLFFYLSILNCFHLVLSFVYIF